MKIKSMLKNLALLSLVAGSVGAITSCKGKDNPTTSNTTTTTTVTTTTTTTTTTTSSVDLSGLIFDKANSNVTEDFTLPSVYLSNQLTWVSSDESAIKIETVNVGDSVSYIGKVTRPDADKEVTLTAQCGTATKTFTVYVPAITSTEIADSYTFKYNNKTLTSNTYELDGTHTYLGKTATITWSVAQNDVATITDNVLTVNATETAVSVTLTAEFDLNGSKSTKRYKINCQLVQEYTAQEKILKWYNGDYDKEAVDINGYVLWKNNDGNSNYIFMIDETYTGGIYVYRPEISADVYDQLEVGTGITLSGATSQVYNGLVETDSGAGTITLNPDLETYDATKATTAIDELLFVQDLRGPSAVYTKETTLVTLTGWKVESVNAEPSVSASNCELLTVSKTVGGVKKTISIQWSRYYLNKESDGQKDVFTVVNNVAVGDIVDIKGFLGCYKDYQIVLTSSADVVKSDTESTVNVDDIKAATALFDKMDFPSAVATTQTLPLPTLTVPTGVTVDYKVYGFGVEKTADGFVFTPTDTLRQVTITAYITVDGMTFTHNFDIALQTLTLEEQVQSELDTAKEAVKYTNGPAVIELAANGGVFTDVVLTYALNAEAKNAKIDNGNLVIVPTDTAETVTLTVTATQGSVVKTGTVEITVPAIVLTAGADVASSEGDVYVKGVLSAITDAKYGNGTLTAEDGTSITLYGIYDIYGNRYDAIDAANKPAVGDTVVFYGYYTAKFSNYTGTVVSFVKGEGTTEEPSDPEPSDAPEYTVAATISFADKANRTEQSTEKQVWSQNGVTVTNTKAASSNDIIDSSNPVRFYKSSDVKVEYTSEFNVIVFKCADGSKYYFPTTYTLTGAKAYVSGDTCVIVLDKAATSFDITTLPNQIRVSTIDVANTK